MPQQVHALFLGAPLVQCHALAGVGGVQGSASTHRRRVAGDCAEQRAVECGARLDLEACLRTRNGSTVSLPVRARRRAAVRWRAAWPGGHAMGRSAGDRDTARVRAL